MSLASDLLSAGAIPLLREALGTLTVVYAQGSNTKSVASVVRMQASRGGLLGVAEVDPDRCTYIFLASDFTAGFSGANPVRPSAGDSVTPTGETAWDVLQADDVGGALWRVQAARRRARGAA